MPARHRERQGNSLKLLHSITGITMMHIKLLAIKTLIHLATSGLVP